MVLCNDVVRQHCAMALRVGSAGKRYTGGMHIKPYWNTFAVVFICAFAANVVVAYLWNMFFPDSNWSWDATTTSAVIIAAAAYLLHKEK